MKTQKYPAQINTLLDGESPDFAVKSAHIVPFNKSVSYVCFGFIFLIVVGIIFFSLLWPVFLGQEINFQYNKVLVTASLDNWEPLIPPALILGVLALAGFIMSAYGIYSFFAEGAWYLSTSKGFAVYKNNKLNVIDWEKFSEDISVRGTSIGDIELPMKIGQMMSQKRRPAKFIPDKIFIVGVQNVEYIAKLLKKRINQAKQKIK